MGRSILRRLLARTFQDIEPGDVVRVVGRRGVGFVLSVDNGFAVVSRGDGLRDILPFGCIRRVAGSGHEFDGP